MLTKWMISNEISVVQINPYAVKQNKEIEDNSQLKDYRKYRKVIADLVKDGNYGMPYLLEAIYADMRRFCSSEISLQKTGTEISIVFTAN